MKSNTHPDWHDDTQVTCACGNKFTTGSVNKVIETDICSECHPFFTGEMRFVDTQGRVEKFQAKMDSANKLKATKKVKTEQKKKNVRPESLKDMLLKEKKRLEESETKKSS
jgi:large subunit ribosomal protein L31